MHGDDIIDGRGGFDGVENNFLLDPITVDLEHGRVVGQGTDQLLRIEAVGGTIGADVMLGGPGDDALTARRDGNDRIEGRGGNDDLAGSPGDDFLDGGDGPDDNANGGDGTDTCLAETIAECESSEPRFVQGDVAVEEHRAANGTSGAELRSQFNSSGDGVTFERLTTGLYRVTFENIGSPGGVALVDRFSTGSKSCVLRDWQPVSNGPRTDERVDIACFDVHGTLEDATFEMSYLRIDGGTSPDVPGMSHIDERKG